MRYLLLRKYDTELIFPFIINSKLSEIKFYRLLLLFVSCFPSSNLLFD